LLLVIFIVVAVSIKFNPLAAEINDDDNLEEEGWISDIVKAKNLVLKA